MRKARPSTRESTATKSVGAGGGRRKEEDTGCIAEEVGRSLSDHADLGVAATELADLEVVAGFVDPAVVAGSADQTG